jgi:hypothetical protein
LLAILLVPIAFVVLVLSGVLSPLVRQEALAALQRVLPPGFTAEVGSASTVFDGFGGLGVSFDEIRLSDKTTGASIFSAGRATMAVSSLSLLRGSPEVRRITISDADINLPANARQDSPLPTVSELPDRLSEVFGQARQLLAGTASNGVAMDFLVSDVNLTFTGGAELTIAAARLYGPPANREIVADLEMYERPFTVSGTLSTNSAGRLGIDLQGDGFPIPVTNIATMLSAVESDHEPGARRDPILANIRLTAQETPEEEPDALTFSVAPIDFSLKLDDGDFITLNARFDFEWVPDRKMLALKSSPFAIGRSSALVSGAIRDHAAPAGSDGAGAYEFQLLGSRGVSNPADSPEAPVRFATKVDGQWNPSEAVVEFTRLELDSSSGYAEAAGRIDYGIEIPTALFAVSVTDFSLQGVKQFWPASVARAARRWVLSNLAGGQVTKGEFLIAEPMRRRIEGTDERLQGDSEVELAVEGVRFDVTGEIPPVRDATGTVRFKDGSATITLDKGTAYLPSGRTTNASNGTLVIHPEDEQKRVMADLELDVEGDADAIGELISFRPISAKRFRDYEPEELSGSVDARVTMRFALNPDENTPPPDWDVELDLQNASLSTPFEGRLLSELTGRVAIDPRRADIDVDGRIDGLPAHIVMVQPFEGGDVQAEREIVLELSDEDRAKIAPGLDDIVSGITPVQVSGAREDGQMAITADLTAAQLSLPWIGWSKGSGIDSSTKFDLVIDGDETRIRNFVLDGNSFSAAGDITVSEAGIRQARFGKVKLNETDDIAVTIDRSGKGYSIAVNGASFDARALLRHIRKQLASGGGGGGVPIELSATIGSVRGFGGERLTGLKMSMRHDGENLVGLDLTASSASGFPVSVKLSGAGADRTITADALDGGEILRFLDIYGQVRGGILTLSLRGSGASGLVGPLTLDDFRIFDEPRLKSLVSTSAGNSGSLSQALKREIDTSEVGFDNARVVLSIAPGRLDVAEGVVRGTLVGSTFQGTVFDRNNQMRMTGTFMPAYGLNSLFADIPILGVLLGNGNDRGLIGVTYLLEGDYRKPGVSVNPLSVIAPGVFRSIFEYR